MDRPLNSFEQEVKNFISERLSIRDLNKEIDRAIDRKASSEQRLEGYTAKLVGYLKAGGDDSKQISKFVVISGITYHIKMNLGIIDVEEIEVIKIS